MAKRSVIVAYLLWAIGGWCGLHHFYLKRHAQAILWMTSGMVFGWGGLRDMWRIPAYVREVNADPHELRKLEALQRASPRPDVNPSHVSATVGLGFWYYHLVGALASWLVPTPAMPLAYACAAWAMATAGWAVFSCGHVVACNYRIVVMATVVAAVAASFVPHVPTVFASSFVCVVALVLTRRWRRDGVFGKEDKPITFRRASFVLALFAIFAAVCGFAMYRWAIDLDVYSLDPETGEWGLDGEEFAFRLRRGVHKSWTAGGFAGFGDLDHFNSGVTAAEARELLSLTKGASAEDVKAAFRRESLSWHPDKYRGDDPEGAKEMQHRLAQARDVLLPGRAAWLHDMENTPGFIKYTESEVEIPMDERYDAHVEPEPESEPEAEMTPEPEPEPEAEITSEPEAETEKYYREEEPDAADDDDYDPQAMEDELRRAFATYDRDADGTMARGEFRFAMSKAGLTYTNEEFENVWTTEFSGKPSLDFTDFAAFVAKNDVEPPNVEPPGQHGHGHDDTEL